MHGRSSENILDFIHDDLKAIKAQKLEVLRLIGDEDNQLTREINRLIDLTDAAIDKTIKEAWEVWG